MLMRTFIPFTALLLFLALPALSSTPAVADDEPISVAASMMGPDWPAGPRQLPTTSPDIYLGNLNAEIQALQERLDANSGAPFRPALAEAYYHRYRIEGRQADLLAAATLVGDPREKNSPRSLLLGARIMSTQHRFDEALKQLETARQAGATDHAVEAQIASVRRARSDNPSARPTADAHRWQDLVQNAGWLLDRGDLVAASRSLRAAQDAYTDTSPVGLAWIHVMQGIAFLRHGRPDLATPFFDAATRRLPTYYVALEHLAETDLEAGHLDLAARRYARVVEQTGHPLFIAQLAETFRRQGLAEQALAWQDRAHREMDAWIEERPLEAADHAVDFLLDGGQVDRALALARQNLSNRPNVHAWLLLSRVEAEAGNMPAARKALEQARATGMRPPEMSELADRLAAETQAPGPDETVALSSSANRAETNGESAAAPLR